MLYSFDGKQPGIGKDTYVSEHALVIGDVKIGDNCYIGHGAILRGDYGAIEVGSGTAIEEGAIVHAPPKSMHPDNYKCKIGKKVTIGHGAVIHCSEIGDSTVIGMRSVISIFSVVGAGTIVAEGAVVKFGQIVPEKVVAAGSPAAIVREVNEKETEAWAAVKQLYSDLAKKYLTEGMHKVSL